VAALNDRRRSGGGGVPREPIALAKSRGVCTRGVSQVAGCCDSRSRVHARRSLLAVRSRRRRRRRRRLRLRLREAPLGRSRASRRRVPSRSSRQPLPFLSFSLFPLVSIATGHSSLPLSPSPPSLSLSFVTRQRKQCRVESLGWKPDDGEVTFLRASRSSAASE